MAPTSTSLAQTRLSFDGVKVVKHCHSHFKGPKHFQHHHNCLKQHTPLSMSLKNYLRRHPGVRYIDPLKYDATMKAKRTKRKHMLMDKFKKSKDAERQKNA
jgi:hypothetical protein